MSYVQVTPNTQFTNTLNPTGTLLVTGISNFGQGAVTQLTSNSTAVTLNTNSGQITMYGVLNSTTSATFKVNNSQVLATSAVLASVGQAGQNSLDSGIVPYTVNVNNIAAGSFYLEVTNGGGSNATHAATVTFLVG